MKYWRTWSSRQSWLSPVLALGLLLLAMFPAHLHIHHDEVAAAHAHAFATVQHNIEIGFEGSVEDLEHHETDHVIDLSTDALSRKAADAQSFEALLPQLASIPVPAVRSADRHVSGDSQVVLRPAFLLRPPLRAPPAV